MMFFWVIEGTSRRRPAQVSQCPESGSFFNKIRFPKYLGGNPCNAPWETGIRYKLKSTFFRIWSGSLLLLFNEYKLVFLAENDLKAKHESIFDRNQIKKNIVIYVVDFSIQMKLRMPRVFGTPNSNFALILLEKSNFGQLQRKRAVKVKLMKSSNFGRICLHLIRLSCFTELHEMGRDSMSSA